MSAIVFQYLLVQSHESNRDRMQHLSYDKLSHEKIQVEHVLQVITCRVNYCFATMIIELSLKYVINLAIYF